jgi:hypothetical protein
MRNFLLASLFLSLVAAVAVVPASADSVVYSSGPANDNYGAWQINDSWSATDSFTVAAGGEGDIISGATFVLWLNSGDTLSKITWSISTGQYGAGTLYGSGTASTANVDGGHNTYGFKIDTASFSGLNLYLAPGTYYFTLQRGITADNQQVWWDENDGSSTGYATSAPGAIGTYDCSVNGDCGLSGGETFGLDGFYAPEPSSFMLLGSGLVGLAGMLKRKLNA